MRCLRAAAALLLIAVASSRAENIRFPTDAGVVNVKDAPYNARGDGVADDTRAIQAALNAFPNGNRVIYLPDGTYKISDTLRWPAGVPGASDYKRTILQGQSRDNTILQLSPNAPGFDNPSLRKAVIYTGPRPAQRFRNAVRNLTVHTGTGNPGAVGIQFNASNQGTLRRIKIVSGDGQGVTGLDFTFTDEIGPLLVQDLHVVGFDVGIRTASVINGLVFENITLENQRQFGIWNNSQVFSIRTLLSRNAVPAIRNTGTACLTLLDATLVGTGTASTLPAIDNAATMYARGVQTSGYASAINNTAGNGQDASGPAVVEWVSDNRTSPFLSPLQSLGLAIKDAPAVPWDDPGDWANVKTFGADGSGATNAASAIQAAIDSGQTTVYFPAGNTFRVDGVVRIRGNVRRLIGTEGRFVGSGTFVLEDGPAPVVVFERFYVASGANVGVEHAAARTLVLSSCGPGAVMGTGTGDLFLEDVVAHPFVFNNPRQRIWARQINPEGQDVPKVSNHGATLWILGLKTERGNVVIDTDWGGKTELLGAHIYSTSNPKVDPMFRITDASASFACVGETNYNGNPFQDIVQETRNGVTRTLRKGQVPGRANGSQLPLYVGYENRPRKGEPGIDPF